MTSSGEVAEALLEWSNALLRGQMLGLVRHARKIGLSMSQSVALFRLHGKGLTKAVSDLGGHLGVTSAAASQLLDRLVQQGLIDRVEDPRNRRAKLISLTERGRGVVEEGLKGRLRWFTTLADAMTEEERSTVVAGLKILGRKVAESVPEGDPFDQPAE